MLEPAALGRVDLVFDFADGGVRAHVSGERGETLDLLRRHAELLHRHLREAGFADVTLSFGAGGDTGDSGARDGSIARPHHADPPPPADARVWTAPSPDSHNLDRRA
ncbi:MAG: flagellar hook-length control protein FliK [Pseudomonadota bacterium]